MSSKLKKSKSIARSVLANQILGKTSKFSGLAPLAQDYNVIISYHSGNMVLKVNQMLQNILKTVFCTVFKAGLKPNSIVKSLLPVIYSQA